MNIRDEGAAFDAAAEAETQEKLLRAAFPKLFFGQASDTHFSRREEYADGLLARGQNFINCMIEAVGCATGASGEEALIWQNASRPGGDGRHVSSMIMRACRTKGSIDSAIAAVGLPSNRFFQSLDGRKITIARRCASMMACEGYVTDDGRTVKYNGERYGAMRDRFKALHVGDILWRPSGWSDTTTGHGIVHLYEKSAKNEMTVIICNSGQGLGVGHYKSGTNTDNAGFIGNDFTVKPIMFRLDHIDMTAPQFDELGYWHMFERCGEFGSRLHPAMSVAFGLSHLAGKTLGKGIADSDQSLQSWPTTAQRGPTCGFRCRHKAQTYMHQRWGLTKSESKEITFVGRLFYIVAAGEQLAAMRHDAGEADAELSAAAIPNSGWGGKYWSGAGMAPPSSEMLANLGRTEYIVYDYAIQDLALCGLKLHERGALSEGGLQLCVAVCRRVRQLLPPRRTYDFPLQPPLGQFGSSPGDCERPPSGPAGAACGVVDLLLDYRTDLGEEYRSALGEKGIKALAGPKVYSVFPAVFDAAAVQKQMQCASDLHKLVAALDAMSSGIEELQRRFETDGIFVGGSLHILALLHSTFGGSVLPPPPAPSCAVSPFDDQGSAWTTGVTPDLQGRCISVLLELACELAAASRATPRSNTNNSMTVICIGYIVACADAVAVSAAKVDAGDDASKATRWTKEYRKLALKSSSAANVLYANATADAPITDPHACVKRAQTQAYFDAAATRSKTAFLDWLVEDDAEKQVCFRLPVKVSPLEPSLDLFLKAAQIAGYKPASGPNKWTAKHAARGATTTRDAPIMPMGGRANDFPCGYVRRIAKHKELTDAGVTFEGVPDRYCGVSDAHEVLAEWAFGTKDNNKLFARMPSLCDMRDLLLLLRISLEPLNWNAQPHGSAGSGTREGKLAPWRRVHARPTLIGYKRHLTADGAYHAYLASIVAFNRCWTLGRVASPGGASLDHPFLYQGTKWDGTVAQKALPDKTEDDVLHAEALPTFGGNLASDEIEILMSYLAVPSLRVPLILSFFASTGRLTSLFNEKLRKILWAAVFAPGEWSPAKSPVEPGAPDALEAFPPADRTRLFYRQGFLRAELRTQPMMVLSSMASILSNALRVASIGGITSPYAETFLFATRLAHGIYENAVELLITFTGGAGSDASFHDTKLAQQDGLPGTPLPNVVEALAQGVSMLRKLLARPARSLLRAWIAESVAVGEGVKYGGDDDEDLTPFEVNARDVLNRATAQGMLIAASAHLALLSSPSIFSRSDAIPDPSEYASFNNTGDLAGDADALRSVSDLLGTFAYVVEWYGKGLASKVYGSCKSVTTDMPAWNDKPSRKVWAGQDELWCMQSTGDEPSFVPETPIDSLKMQPLLLWTALASRRVAVVRWIEENQRNEEKWSAMLSGAMQLALGDAEERWERRDVGDADAEAAASAERGPNDIVKGESFIFGKRGDSADSADPTKRSMPGIYTASKTRLYSGMPVIEGTKFDFYWTNNRGANLATPGDGDRWHITIHGQNGGCCGWGCGNFVGAWNDPAEYGITRRAQPKGGARDRGFFTAKDLSVHFDAQLAALTFAAGGCGKIKMPDSIASNKHFQSYMASERGGVKSILMPHLVLVEKRERRQWYHMPPIGSNSGLELKLWTALDDDSLVKKEDAALIQRICDHTENSASLDTSGAPVAQTTVVTGMPVKSRGDGIDYLGVKYGGSGREFKAGVFRSLELLGKLRTSVRPPRIIGANYKSDIGNTTDEFNSDPSAKKWRLRATEGTVSTRRWEISSLAFIDAQGKELTKQMTPFSSGAETSALGPEQAIKSGSAPPNAALVAAIGFEVENTVESSRSYSSVWDNDAPGSGHARSMIDSERAWCVGTSDSSQWMKIDLGTPQLLVGAVFQGRHDVFTSQYVKSINIAVSTDDQAWKTVVTEADISGAKGDIQAQVLFPIAVQGRFVRFSPQQWNEHISMRAAVLLSNTVSAGYWCGSNAAGGSDDFYIGAEFEHPVTVKGIVLKQHLPRGLRDIPAGEEDDYDAEFHTAQSASLEYWSESDGKWKLAAHYEALDYRKGKSQTLPLALNPGFIAGTSERATVGALLETANENWVMELLARCLDLALAGNPTPNHTVTLALPTTPLLITDDRMTVVVRDALKPTWAQWSILNLDRTHNRATVFGLREYGRRAYPVLVYTSDYAACRCESGMVPDNIQKMQQPFLAHPFVERAGGSFWDTALDTGGWGRGSEPTTSLVVHRKVGSTLQQLIPAEFLAGVVLPEVLTNAFRFWRTNIASDGDGSASIGDIVGQRLPDADESWFGYDLELREAHAGDVAMSLSDAELHRLNTQIERCEKKVAMLKKKGGKGALMSAAKALNELREKRRTAPSAPMASRTGGAVSAAYDVVRSAPDMADASRMIRHRLIDLMAPDLDTGGWLSQVARLMMRIENLSYVLAWAELPSERYSATTGAKEAADDRVERCVAVIELPRLRLHFNAKLDAMGRVRLYSAENSGKFVIPAPEDDGRDTNDPETSTADESDEGLKRLCSLTPYSLLLGDDSGGRFLLVPSCPQNPEHFISNCPWSNNHFPDRSNVVWLETFTTRCYVFPVPAHRLWLEMPSLEAALFWSCLQALDRRYVACAQTIGALGCDERLSPHERFQLKQWEQTFGSRDDFHVTALRTKLWIRFRHSPIVDDWPWEAVPSKKVPVPKCVHPTNSAFLARSQFAHVAGCCRLSFDDERIVYAAAPNGGRLKYIDAIESGGAVVGASGQAALRVEKIGIIPGTDCGADYLAFIQPSSLQHAFDEAATLKTKADAMTDGDGWTILHKTFFHENMADNKGRFDGNNGEPKSLAAAKIMFFKSQTMDGDHAFAITERKGQYYHLRKRVAPQRSGDEISHLHHPRSDSARDPRGCRAPLWLEERIRRCEPFSRNFAGSACCGANGIINSFLEDPLGGGLDGTGFLLMYEVLSGEVRNGSAIELSVDGTQNNTQSLMSFVVDCIYRDRKCLGPNGVDETLPMSILATMATHVIGSIKGLPTIAKLLATPGAKKCIEIGSCAGSLDGLPKEIKEISNEEDDRFQFHIGNFMAEAAAVCSAHLAGSSERKTRYGVALWDKPVYRASVKKQFGIIGAPRERLQLPMPKPKEFGNPEITLSGASFPAERLVEFGSFPLLSLAKKVTSECGIVLTPALPDATKSSVEADQYAVAKRHTEAKERALAEHAGGTASSATTTSLKFPLPLQSAEFASPVGVSMRKRLEASMVDFVVAKAQAESDSRSHALKSKHATAAQALDQVWDAVLQEISNARDGMRATFRKLDTQLNAIEVVVREEANNGTPSRVGGSEGVQRLTLAKLGFFETHISLPLLLGSTMAAKGVAQLRNAAPLLSSASAKKMIDSAAMMLLYVNRLNQLLRCGASAKKARAKGGDSGIAALGGFIGQLTSQRHYVTIGGSDTRPTITFDPRFAMFEFSTTFIMWRRQMNLVQQFASEALKRGSQAQQMIMGDGKTTVVGPLLSLILASKPQPDGDPNSLQSVTLVCPQALMAQSKSVMRALFSSPAAPKPVYTLKFERSFDSRVSTLGALVGKLELARQQRGVVIASPTAIKSVLLKYIELLVMANSKRRGGMGIGATRTSGGGAGTAAARVVKRADGSRITKLSDPGEWGKGQMFTTTEEPYGPSFKPSAAASWGSALAYDGVMSSLPPGDESYFTWERAHRGSELHDYLPWRGIFGSDPEGRGPIYGATYAIYFGYSAQDSRPCELRIGHSKKSMRVVSTNALSGVTGGWNDEQCKYDHRSHIVINVGTQPDLLRIQLRANGYCPHIHGMLVEPCVDLANLAGATMSCAPQPRKGRWSDFAATRDEHTRRVLPSKAASAPSAALHQHYIAACKRTESLWNAPGLKKVESADGSSRAAPAALMFVDVGNGAVVIASVSDHAGSVLAFVRGGGSQRRRRHIQGYERDRREAAAATSLGGGDSMFATSKIPIVAGIGDSYLENASVRWESCDPAALKPLPFGAEDLIVKIEGWADDGWFRLLRKIRITYGNGRVVEQGILNGDESTRPPNSPSVDVRPGVYITKVTPWRRSQNSPMFIQSLEITLSDGTSSFLEDPKLGWGRGEADEREEYIAPDGMMVSEINLCEDYANLAAYRRNIKTLSFAVACTDPNIVKLAALKQDLVQRAGFTPRKAMDIQFQKSVGDRYDEPGFDDLRWQHTSHWSFEVATAPGHWLVCDANVDAPSRLSIASEAVNDALQMYERTDLEHPGSLLTVGQDSTVRRATFEVIALTKSGVMDAVRRGAAQGGTITKTLASRRADDDHEAAADTLGVLLRQWRSSGVLLMDEVDLLLHPLKSELNFPIGAKMKIDVDGGGAASQNLQNGGEEVPEGLRWELPMALIDAILSASRAAEEGGDVSRSAADDVSISSHAANLATALMNGRREMAIQMKPHLLLLTKSGPVIDDLRKEVANIAIDFITSRQLVWWKRGYTSGAVSIDEMQEYVSLTDGLDWRLKTKFDDALAPATIQLLTLARQWLSTFFCHSFSKINRVNYGLLQGAQLAKEAGDFFNVDDDSSTSRGKAKKPPASPISRLLLALPFVGLEQPSDNSEFAHPDVAIGLTICAYRHEGMRTSDLRILVSDLKAKFLAGIGDVEKRPEYILWEEWLSDAVMEKRKKREKDHQRRGGGGGSRRASAPTKTIAKERATLASGVFSLDTFQLDDKKSFKAAYVLWQHYTPAIYYYLQTLVFPRVMMCQTLKISTSGQALGSSLLFRSRLAFSGTPSDLLPREGDEAKQLFPCVFEKGSEGKMLHTLSYERNVTAWLTERDWSVESLLLHIAHDDSPDHRVDALIDTGALITGKSNQEVAQFLLDHGLRWAAGCVFLNDDDQKMVLLRAGAESEKGRVVREAQCGLAWNNRFSFYDNVHTTGMDIKQHSRAVAVLTIGKDMTFRDYAQGAYRMRGLAKGQPQTIQLYIVPEVRGLIGSQVAEGAVAAVPPPAPGRHATRSSKWVCKECSHMNKATLVTCDCCGSAKPLSSGSGVAGGEEGQMMLLPNSDVKAIIAWLLLNSIRLESKQMMQLAVQNCDGVSRRLALAKMLSSATVDTGEPKEDATLALTEAFVEPVDVALPTTCPVSQSFAEKLSEKVAVNEAVIASDAVGRRCIDEMIALVDEITSAAKAAAVAQGGPDKSAGAWGENDLDTTQTQEREQQVEQEKQKQREVERESSPWKATQRDHDTPARWTLAGLDDLKTATAFFPVSMFKLSEASRLPPGTAAFTKETAAGGQPLLLDGAAAENATSKLDHHTTLLSENFASKSFSSPLERRMRSLQMMVKVGERGVVALSLLEAATLRRAIVEAQAGGAATGTAAARALKKCTVLTVDGYAVASGDDALAAAAAAEAKSETDEDELDALNGPAAAVQLLRFFDGQTSFADDQCMLLLSMLSDVERWKRKRFFNETVLCRRRDDPKWKGTDVALVFQLRSGDELEALERIKTAVVTVLRAQGRSVSEMCAEIDVDNDATLAVDEIVNFFSAPAMQAAEGMPTPAELQGLRRAIKACCDLNGDSSISYEEMRHVFTDKVKVGGKKKTSLRHLSLQQGVVEEDDLDYGDEDIVNPAIAEKAGEAAAATAAAAMRARHYRADRVKAAAERGAAAERAAAAKARYTPSAVAVRTSIVPGGAGAGGDDVVQKKGSKCASCLQAWFHCGAADSNIEGKDKRCCDACSPFVQGQVGHMWNIIFFPFVLFLGYFRVYIWPYQAVVFDRCCRALCCAPCAKAPDSKLAQCCRQHPHLDEDCAIPKEGRGFTRLSDLIGAHSEAALQRQEAALAKHAAAIKSATAAFERAKMTYAALDEDAKANASAPELGSPAKEDAAGDPRLVPRLPPPPALPLFAGDITVEKLERALLGARASKKRWIVAALANAADHPAAIRSRFKTKERSFRGKYALVLWYRGAWRTVVIDDFVPFQGEIQSVPDIETGGIAPTEVGPHASPFGSVPTVELWPRLFEKALAVLAQTYGRPDDGTVEESGGYAMLENPAHFNEQVVFSALTGSVGRRIYTDKAACQSALAAINGEHPFDAICRLTAMEALISVRFNNEATQGLARDHPYSVVDARRVALGPRGCCGAAPPEEDATTVLGSTPGEHGDALLLKIRNSASEEWSGRWSDDSKEWESSSHHKLKERLGFTNAADDGIFWMEWSDFQRLAGEVTYYERAGGARDLALDLHEDISDLTSCAGKFAHSCGPTRGLLEGTFSYFFKCVGAQALYCPSRGAHWAISIPLRFYGLLCSLTLVLSSATCVVVGLAASADVVALAGALGSGFSLAELPIVLVGVLAAAGIFGFSLAELIVLCRFSFNDALMPFNRRKARAAARLVARHTKALQERRAKIEHGAAVDSVPSEDSLHEAHEKAVAGLDAKCARCVPHTSGTCQLVVAIGLAVCAVVGHVVLITLMFIVPPPGLWAVQCINASWCIVTLAEFGLLGPLFALVIQRRARWGQGRLDAYHAI